MEDYETRIKNCAEKAKELYSKIMNGIPEELKMKIENYLSEKQSLLEEAKSKKIIIGKVQNIKNFVDSFDGIKKEHNLLKCVSE